MTAYITYLPRLDIPFLPGMYTVGRVERFGDFWQLTPSGRWFHKGRQVDAREVPAGLHRVGIAHTPDVRPLTQVEEQTIARALEARAWKMRAEGQSLDFEGTRDEAHGYYAQADQAQAVLNLLPWMRVQS